MVNDVMCLHLHDEQRLSSRGVPASFRRISIGKAVRFDHAGVTAVHLRFLGLSGHACGLQSQITLRPAPFHGSEAINDNKWWQGPCCMYGVCYPDDG